MKITVVLGLLIGIFVLACSTAVLSPAEPTPHMEATVEDTPQSMAIPTPIQVRTSPPLPPPPPTQMLAMDKPTPTRVVIEPRLVAVTTFEILTSNCLGITVEKPVLMMVNY